MRPAAEYLHPPLVAEHHYVSRMEPDEAADLLGDIHPQQAGVVVAAGLADPEEVRALLSGCSSTSPSPE